MSKETKVIEIVAGKGDKKGTETLMNTGVAMVDFWAPWCGPCRMIAPVIEELADDFEGRANICKVNTDEQQDIAVKFGIRSIPTVIFLKDGEIIDTIIGASPKTEYADRLNKLIGR